jgi:hypothetical protein
MILLGLALLGTAGLVVLYRRFPPDKIKALALARARTSLGREVAFDDLTVGARGLVLRGLNVSERPDFSAGTFLSCREARVAPDWRALLRGRWDVGGVDLQSPRLHLHRDAAGALNIDDLRPAAPTASPGAPAAVGAAAWTLRHLRLRDASVTFTNDAPAWTAAFSDGDIELGGWSPGAPLRLRAAGSLAGRWERGPFTGTAAFRGTFFPTEDRLAIDEFSLRTGGSVLALAGDIRTFVDPTWDLRLQSSPLTAAALLPFVDLPAALHTARVNGLIAAVGDRRGLTLDLDLSAEAAGVSGGLVLSGRLVDPFGAPSVDLAGRLSRLALARDGAAGLDASDVSADITVTGPARGPTFDLSLDGGPSAAALGTWLAKPAGRPFQARLHLTLAEELADSAFDLHVRTEGMDLRSPGPWPEDLTLNGPVSWSADASGSFIRAGATVTVNAGDAAVAWTDQFRKPAGIPWSARLVARWNDAGAITLAPLTWSLAEQRGRAEGLLQKSGDAVALRLALRAEDWDLTSLAPLFPAAVALAPTGELSARVALEGSVDHLRPTGDVDLHDVAVAPRPGVTLAGLTGRWTWGKDGALATRDFRGRLNDAPFVLGLRIGPGPTPTVEVDAGFDRLDVTPFLPTPSTATTAPSASNGTRGRLARVQGRLRAGTFTAPYLSGVSAQADWVLTDVSRDLAALGGELSFSLSDGEIRDIPLAVKINRLLDRPDESLRFRQWSGHGTVVKGRLATPDLSLIGRDMSLDARGTVDLTSRDSDLRLTITLSSGTFRGSLGPLLADADGRSSVDLNVRGPLTGPQVRLDGSGVVRDVTRNLIRRGLEKIAAPVAPVTPSSTTAPSPLRELQKNLGKNFRRLLNK